MTKEIIITMAPASEDAWIRIWYQIRYGYGYKYKCVGQNGVSVHPSQQGDLLEMTNLTCNYVTFNISIPRTSPPLSHVITPNMMHDHHFHHWNSELHQEYCPTVTSKSKGTCNHHQLNTTPGLNYHHGCQQLLKSKPQQIIATLLKSLTHGDATMED
jgi:hypothetical protein